MSCETPVVRFGVLTDTQYADCDSKPAWYNPNLTRYYRSSLDQIDKAFELWAKEEVSFALQLGDIIDGVNRWISDPNQALKIALSKFEKNKNIPTFHTVGNHELYNFNRQDLSRYFYDYLEKMDLSSSILNIPMTDLVEERQRNDNVDLNRQLDSSLAWSSRDDQVAPMADYSKSCLLLPEGESKSVSSSQIQNEAFFDCKAQSTISKQAAATAETNSLPLPYLYYAFRPVEGVKFVSLDCFEVSVIGYEKENPRYKEAAAILFKHHGHEDFEGWDCADLLEGSGKRFQQMNGAVSQEQLDWLDQQLLESDMRGEKVVVFGHVGLHPESADWDCMLWNYDQVVDIFDKHSCVILYLCGHTHQNGYAMDRKGIHYVVLAGIIETAPEECAFATVAIYRNRIEITGHGRETSRTLLLEKREMLQNEDEAPSETETPVLLSVKVLV